MKKFKFGVSIGFKPEEVNAILRPEQMAKLQAKVVPALPDGIKVMERPVGLDFMQRGNDRWFKAI